MGITILAMGIIIRVNSDIIGIVADNSWFTVAYIMIAAGVFIFLIALIGFCGARNGNKCLLGIYLGVLVAIFIVEIAGAIYGAVNRVSIENAARTKMTVEVKSRYGTAGQNAITVAFDRLQTSFRCCGVNDYRDWKNSTWGQQIPNVQVAYGNPVPDSCCRNVSSNCGINPANHQNEATFNSSFYTAGCYMSVRNSITNNLGVAIGILGGFAGIQILGMVLAGVLITKAGEE